jgi:hypothetical protein
MIKLSELFNKVKIKINVNIELVFISGLKYSKIGKICFYTKDLLKTSK